LEDQLGSLDPGKRADFAIVDLSPPATQPVYDPVESMVYSASRADVRSVFIGGREVSLDDTEILKECGRIVRKLSGKG
jgi:5-methylthioadenosine/S-adenosylhomocysteine deaminase